MFMMFIITDHLRENIAKYTDEVDVNCEKCRDSGKYIRFSMDFRRFYSLEIKDHISFSFFFAMNLEKSIFTLSHCI